MKGLEQSAQGSQEAHDKILLDKINFYLKDLEDFFPYSRLSEYYPEYQFLKGKKVIMIDDQPMPIELNFPYLVQATDDNASFILYKDEQNFEDVIKKILNDNPDIVLIDYDLSRGNYISNGRGGLIEDQKGTTIIRESIKRGFKGKFIGFSGEGRGTEFEDAGAIGSVKKLGDLDSNAIVGVGELIGKHR